MKRKFSLDNLLHSNLVLTLIAIAFAFVVGGVFLQCIGISPFVAYAKLLESAFSTPKSISYCIVYGTPLIFTGLSVAFSFRTGVFNIGAEGQFVVGSMAACVIGILVPAPAIVLVPLCLLAAAAAGALWGFIVGVLKTKWGINEVLSMIMFNWIAFYLSNYIVSIPAIHSEGSAEATKNVSDAARILLPEGIREALGLANTTNWGIILAGLFAIAIYLIIEKTTLGYELKAVGFNRHAAEYGGINVNRAMLTALSISGALAGMGGAVQLMGMGQRISVFAGQEGYGFDGIVVALIGSSNPLGVVIAGIFYGALKYAGSKLNLIGAPSEVIKIITGTVVFFIAISHIFKIVKKRKAGKK